MAAVNEDDLRGPQLATVDPVGAPPWWRTGSRIKRVQDGQQATAAFDIDGGLVAVVVRGVAGTFKLPAQLSDWEAGDPDPELEPMELTRVCYEADRALRTALGLAGIPEWSLLLEQTRMALLSALRANAPFEGDFAMPRRHLRRAICVALEGPCER